MRYYQTFGFYLLLIDLDKEEEDGKVGGDGDSNVQLHCLHLDHQGQVCVINVIVIVFVCCMAGASVICWSKAWSDGDMIQS